MQHNQQQRTITLRLSQGVRKTELDANTTLRFSTSTANGVSGLAAGTLPSELEATGYDPYENGCISQDGVALSLIVGEYRTNQSAVFDGRVIEIPIHSHHVWSGAVSKQCGTVQVKLVAKVADKYLDSKEKDRRQARKDEIGFAILKFVVRSILGLQKAGEKVSSFLRKQRAK